MRWGDQNRASSPLECTLPSHGSLPPPYFQKQKQIAKYNVQEEIGSSCKGLKVASSELGG